MTRKHDSRHLTAQRIQAFLDGALPEREAGAVREHAESCARCRADLDAWQLLFGELSELDRLEPSLGLSAGVLLDIRTAADERLDAALEQLAHHAPSPAFAARVMDGLRERAQVAARVSDAEVEALLAGLGHYEPSPIFAARVMDAWETETAEQAALEHEIDEALAGLGHLEPSPVMAARVMTRIRIGALVHGGVREKKHPVAAAARSAVSVARDAWAAFGRIVPKTRKAWAVISGVAVTPVSIVALLAWTVFSNPLATPATLARFAWWQASAFVGSLWASAGEVVFESPVLAQLYAAAEYLSATPMMAVAGATSFGLLTLGALWILYRNLIPTRSVDTRYARAAA